MSSLLCLCFFAVASLSSLFLSKWVIDVIKSSIKDKKLFGIICIHVCLWLLLSTTSAHTWSWVLLCVCLFSLSFCVCVWNYMNLKSIITERRKARFDPARVMMICMCVGWWSSATSVTLPTIHLCPLPSYTQTSRNRDKCTHFSRSVKPLAAERERRTNTSSIYQGRDNTLVDMDCILQLTQMKWGYDC